MSTKVVVDEAADPFAFSAENPAQNIFDQEICSPVSEPFRDSNAYLSPSPWAQPGWSRYQNGAMSAPAGH